jgi:hypothetical protein
MVKGSGAKNSSKGYLMKEILSNEVLLTPIHKLDLVS